MARKAIKWHRATMPVRAALRVKAQTQTEELPAMSDTNPTPIALMIPYASGPKPGRARLYITITNSDGTPPALALDPSSAGSNVVSLVQPVANDGSNTAFPVAQYPYVGEIDAAADGEANVDLLADGIVNQVFAVTVTTGTAETAAVPDGAIVVDAPGAY